MPETVQTLLNMLAQFTGGRGGIDHVIVNYAIAAFFWGVLWNIARARQRQAPAPREVLLLWGFGFAMARELFMIAMAMLQALKLVDPVALHTIFPPLEHELHDLSLVFLGAAYLRFLLDDAQLARRFLVLGLVVTFACYLVTFQWWADYIVANPESKFGQVWTDWVFHINRSVWAVAAAMILAMKSQGWARNTVVTAFLFFFIDAVLKLPDMALGEVYENVFTPIARSFYLVGIPLFGYVYLREQWQERQRAELALQAAHNDLEAQVKDRTEALQVALLKEERAVADLGAFSYSVAHDLKAPLRAMGGFSQALVEDYGDALDQTAKGYLGHVIDGAERLKELIDGLLRFSLLGRDDLKFEQVDLAQLVTRVQSNLQSDIDRGRVRIEAADGLPVIESHRLTLESIFQNLISNAMKYTATGTTAEIKLLVHEDADSVVLSVQDNGIGIDPTDQARIFNVFERLHTNDEFAGTGIGLAIVKKSVDLLHGSISLQSQVGVGSTFSVKLPRQQTSPNPMRTAHRANSET